MSKPKDFIDQLKEVGKAAGKAFIKPIGKSLSAGAEQVGDFIDRVENLLSPSRQDAPPPPKRSTSPKKQQAADPGDHPPVFKKNRKPAESSSAGSSAFHSPKKEPSRKPDPAPQPASGTRPRRTPKKPPEPAVSTHDRLLAQMGDAIHRTYYKEDGFRFFAVKFCRYTQLVLPGESDPHAMWVSAYNSCIEPILYQLSKLKKQLEPIVAQTDKPLVPANQPLLDAMVTFALRAKNEGLSSPDGWEAEDYKAALIRYGTDLKQLLDAYPSAED